MAQRYREQTARFRQLGLTIPALKRVDSFQKLPQVERSQVGLKNTVESNNCVVCVNHCMVCVNRVAAVSLNDLEIDCCPAEE